ncbi:MAG: hypothetical protein ACREQZ_10700, partial [Woeseiaceae bacterium]
GLHVWEVADRGPAADGVHFMRPTFIDSNRSAEITWEDNFRSGVLTYRVFIDDRHCCDILEVYLDGELVEGIDRRQSWQEHFVVIPDGHHVVRWRLVRSRTSSDSPLRTHIDLIRYSGPDRDGDGMPTVWELTYGLDPDDGSDGVLDNDQDSLSNADEFALGTSPTSADTDNDGMPDAWEAANGLDPLIDDAAEDPDGDALSNWQEHDLGTSPQNADTDGDEMPDGWEVDHDLDPLDDDASADPDGDGTSNLDEYRNGTHPQIDDAPSGGGGGSGGGSSGGGSSGGDGGSGGGAVDWFTLLFALLACVGHSNLNHKENTHADSRRQVSRI